MKHMSQPELATFFENCWNEKENYQIESNLSYSDPIEDAVLYKVYKELLEKLNCITDKTSILDIGCGSGRWIRYFNENFQPKSIHGIDLATSSIKLLKKYFKGDNKISLSNANICDPELNLEQQFDLINVSNVFFHIVEQDLLVEALLNLKKHLAPNGYAVTTEYLPKNTMRTPMMLVHNREDFQRLIDHCGLKIVEVNAFAFLCNDPMGLEPSETEARTNFNKARAGIKKLLKNARSPEERQEYVSLFSTIEDAFNEFCEPRIDQVDYPSQKLVVLAHA